MDALYWVSAQLMFKLPHLIYNFNEIYTVFKGGKLGEKIIHSRSNSESQSLIFLENTSIQQSPPPMTSMVHVTWRCSASRWRHGIVSSGSGELSGLNSYRQICEKEEFFRMFFSSVLYSPRFPNSFVSRVVLCGTNYLPSVNCFRVKTRFVFF